jgi:hypothetical protein
MAQFTITTTPEEQEKVYNAVKKLEGAAAPVTKVAKTAGMNPNRVRYVLIDLIDAGKIAKIPTKAFNPHYIRYMYQTLPVKE